jgi:hypothetical protein
MHTLLRAALLAAALAATSGAALADDVVSEKRTVDPRAVKINLDGVVSLKLKQGPSAALTLYGEKRYLDKINVTQNGDTLRIDSALRGVRLGRNELRAELTLPNLRELVSGGVGSAEVNGFSGEELRLALDGAGTVKVNANYRNVSAKLAGVGSMTVEVGRSDSVDLDLRGAGQIQISGQSKTLHANLGGVGSLDAQQLQADNVDLSMSGLGGAAVYARSSAKLKLSGMGSATVYGKPAVRSAATHGMGGVSWQ